MRKSLFSLLLVSGSLLAGDVAAIIPLAKPTTTGGMALMQALSERKSTREFSDQKLPNEMLSNLLWAAYGVNRPDGRRTAPSANNRQIVDVYVTLPEGAYLYRPKEHRLDLVSPGDWRGAAGVQPFVAEAPLNLVYVADYSRVTSTPAEDKILYSAAETGFVGQNVYLFCASEGLATVVRAMIDRTKLAEALKLRPDQKIMLAQTVGYPKRKP